MVQPLGEHFIIELYQCEKDILDSQTKIESALLKAAELGQTTVLGSHFHKFSPQGVSGVVVIAESHLSIHTWPELHYAALDFFTCGSTDNMDRVFDHLRNAFSPGDMRVRRIERGLEARTPDEQPLLSLESSH